MAQHNHNGSMGEVNLAETLRNRIGDDNKQLKDLMMNVPGFLESLKRQDPSKFKQLVAMLSANNNNDNNNSNNNNNNNGNNDNGNNVIPVSTKPPDTKPATANNKSGNLSHGDGGNDNINAGHGDPDQCNNSKSFTLPNMPGLSGYPSSVGNLSQQFPHLQQFQQFQQFQHLQKLQKEQLQQLQQSQQQQQHSLTKQKQQQQQQKQQKQQQTKPKSGHQPYKRRPSLYYRINNIDPDAEEENNSDDSSDDDDDDDFASKSNPSNIFNQRNQLNQLNQRIQQQQQQQRQQYVYGQQLGYGQHGGYGGYGQLGQLGQLGQHGGYGMGNGMGNGMGYESKMADISQDENFLKKYSGLQWYCMIDIPNTPNTVNTPNGKKKETMYWSPYPSNIQKELFIAWKKFCCSPNVPSTKVAHITVQGSHYRVFFIKDQISQATPCAFQMSDGGLRRHVRLDKPDEKGNIWNVPIKS